MFLLLLLSSFIGAAAADKVVVTSGRVVYDAFGRAVKTYHPTVDSDTVVLFSTSLDAVRPTVTVYDELDRPVKVIYPDETETNTMYFVEGRALVTRVTDALGHTCDTHVTASGKTLKSVRYNSAGLTNAITTQYAYDGLGRLVSVTDADGNVTESEYDMGDRRVRVVHPASGETRFTYDALGNVLTRQTANLRDSALFIVYGYDRGRLVSVSYPKHPENDVQYYYGGENDRSNAKGRLCFRRDATGGEQFAYDNMGNVSQRLRTVTVPNEAVVTFKTEFEYDSYGKLLSMTYPDGEKVCYWYDASGQLSDVYVNDRKKGDYYVEKIGYDKFGDRIYMRYGNGATAEYAYDEQMRRLVHRLDTLSHERPVSRLERTYDYDLVGNITSLQATGDTLLFDPVSHTYGYDHLYRLTSATGNAGSDPNRYTLAMTYDKMYRVKTKKQHLWQKDIQFGGALLSGYDLSYSYSTAPGRRFQMSMVSDLNYRAEGSHSASDNVYEKHYYEYDPNGNILRVRTSRRMADKDYRELAHEERFRWDEENRLMAIAQDGYVSNYWYDADGERVIKEHGGNQAVFVNSLQDSVLTDTRQFTVYPSPYLVVHNGDWYTKHIYIGAERIASRMGILPDGLSFGENESAGGNVFEDIHYSDQCDMMAQVMKSNYEYFGLPYNGENRHAEDGDGMVSTDPRGGGAAGLTGGGPRYYWMMADAGDGEGGSPGGTDRSGKGNRYYYHSDHLGSSSLITDDSCHVTQQMEYLPYGEVFLERRRHSDPSQPLYATPYKFNGKELDEETGLYYYGARYMNPRLSIWYGTDPMQEKYPNVSSYCYTMSNPIALIDVNGEAWKPTQNEIDGTYTGYQWIPEEQSYDKSGKLLPGLYEQAIFFSNEGINGKFDPSSNYNIGTSTATVYKSDGTTSTFNACTYPSDISAYATIPEGIYEAKVGIHNRKYEALRLSDIGTVNFYENSIELGYPNPSNKSRTTAQGINIHRPGKGNLTGIYNVSKAISEGCILIDENQWNSFMGVFNKPDMRNSLISVTVSRSMSSPSNQNYRLHRQPKVIMQNDATRVEIKNPFKRLKL